MVSAPAVWAERVMSWISLRRRVMSCAQVWMGFRGYGLPGETGQHAV
ncbi:hypothetical protein [Dactylosporangium cerinum]